MPLTRAPRNSLAAALLAFGAASLPVIAQTTPPRPATKASPKVASAGAINERINTIIADLESKGAAADFDAARDQVLAIFDHVIATTPVPASTHSSQSSSPALNRYVQAAAFSRMLGQVARCDKDQRVRLFSMLRKHPAAAEAITLLFDEKEDIAPRAYDLLARLADKYPKEIDRLAPLAAALCVVHDKPLIRHINENSPKAADPVAIFDFYVKNESRLIMHPAEMPAELLVYVVDTTATPEEMQWALDKYQRDANIGSRYTEVKYDTENFMQGTAKKSDVAGWGLKSIQQFGGVCADQAYFSAMVGKAQGVPTVYVTGRSAAIAHAWLGYLRAFPGGKSAWDFSSGRYDEYLDVRGNVTDPQTGKSISDGHVGILADYLTQKKEVRTQCIALVDAARRLGEIERTKSAFPPVIAGLEDDWKPDSASGKPYTPDVASRLSLLEAALRKAPANVAGWNEVRSMAERGLLSYDDKVKWAEVLFNLCGKNYADFSIDILAPMIGTEADINNQDRLWNAAFNTYRQRPDLASAIRLAQGRMWEKSGDKGKAWEAYQDVIAKFVNQGPFAVDAAADIERLLRNDNKADQVVKMYETTFRKASKPTKAQAEFIRASNWFRLGMLYARSLAKAGNEAQSNRVLTDLGIDPKKFK